MSSFLSLKYIELSLVLASRSPVPISPKRGISAVHCFANAPYETSFLVPRLCLGILNEALPRR